MLTEIKEMLEKILVGFTMCFNLAKWVGAIGAFANSPVITGLFTLVISVLTIIVLVRRGKREQLEIRKLLKEEKANEESDKA